MSQLGLGRRSLTEESDPADSIARSLLALRRQQRRGALAGATPVDHIYAAEVVDVVASRSAVTTVKDIARHLSIDASQASRRVRAAVEAGLADRIAVQHDGRLSGLQLTQQGRRLVNDVQTRRKGLIEQALETWDHADRRRLANLLNRFVHDLDANLQTRPGRSTVDEAG